MADGGRLAGGNANSLSRCAGPPLALPLRRSRLLSEKSASATFFQ
jgi:hypothetical protein